MVFHTCNNCIFISVKVARHASSETRARLNVPNMGSAVAAVACAAWVADVVALVDVSIIVANASSIANPVLIKRKYQYARTHARGNIHTSRHRCLYSNVSLYNNACLDLRIVSRLSLHSIEFFSEHRQMQFDFTHILLCTCIFTLNFVYF